jgi:hypothetical protein
MDQSIKDYSRQVSGQTKMASVRDGSLKPLEYSDFDGRKMDAQPSNPVTVFELQLLHELIGNTYINAAEAKKSLLMSLNNPSLKDPQKRAVKIMIHQLNKILDIIAAPPNSDDNKISMRKLLDKITISG